MPCRDDYTEEDLRQSRRYDEQARYTLIIKYMKEAGLRPLKGGLDGNTAALCEWCGKYPGLICTMSLEFQKWWIDHQIADKERALREAKAAERKQIKARALAKLTLQERRVLGLD